MQDNFSRIIVENDLNLTNIEQIVRDIREDNIRTVKQTSSTSIYEKNIALPINRYNRHIIDSNNQIKKENIGDSQLPMPITYDRDPFIYFYSIINKINKNRELTLKLEKNNDFLINRMDECYHTKNNQLTRDLYRWLIINLLNNKSTTNHFDSLFKLVKKTLHTFSSVENTDVINIEEQKVISAVIDKIPDNIYDMKSFIHNNFINIFVDNYNYLISGSIIIDFFNDSSFDLIHSHIMRLSFYPGSEEAIIFLEISSIKYPNTNHLLNSILSLNTRKEIVKRLDRDFFLNKYHCFNSCPLLQFKTIENNNIEIERHSKYVNNQEKIDHYINILKNKKQLVPYKKQNKFSINTKITIGILEVILLGISFFIFSPLILIIESVILFPSYLLFILIF